MSKLDILKKTHAFNETGLFRGVSKLLLSMIVADVFDNIAVMFSLNQTACSLP